MKEENKQNVLRDKRFHFRFHFLFLIPLVIITLFGIPAGSQAVMIRQKMKETGKKIFKEETKEVLHYSGKKIDFRHKKSVIKKFQKITKSLPVRNLEFERFFESILLEGFLLDFNKINSIKNENFHKIKKRIEINLPMIIAKEKDLISPILLPIARKNSLGPNMLLRGGFFEKFFEWLNFKSKIVQNIEKNKNPNNLNYLPIPEIPTLVILTITVLKKNISNEKKKTMITKFLKERLEKSFSMLVKYRYFILILFLIFLFKKDILNLIFGSISQRNSGNGGDDGGNSPRTIINRINTLFILFLNVVKNSINIENFSSFNFKRSKNFQFEKVKNIEESPDFQKIQKNFQKWKKEENEEPQKQLR